MLEYFSQNVTVTGSEKYSHKGKVSLVVWTLLLLTATGFCLFHLHNRLEYYFQNPIMISMRTESHNDGMGFPAITICGMNHVKNQRDNCTIALTNMFKKADMPDCDKFDYNDPNWWIDAWLGPYGNNISEKLLLCYQEFTKCPSSTFKPVYLPRHGVCHTYNDSRKITLTGFPDNFLAALDTQTAHYIETTMFQGYYIIIHAPEIAPRVGDSPIFITPGMHTSVTIRRQKRLRLTSPYESHCRNISGDQLYSKERCVQDCYMTGTTNACGCDIRLVVNGTVSGVKRVCSMKELSQCVPKVLQLWLAQAKKCKMLCPEECTSISYIVTSTSVTKMHGTGLLKLLNILDSDLGKPRGKAITEDYAQKNVASFSIQYEDLVTEVIEQTPAYTWLALLADLGGALGLGMGACLMTLFQFFDFVFVFLNKLMKGNMVERPLVTRVIPHKPSDQ